MDLPIEIINLILYYAQFNKLNELLKLRLVSWRWSHAVEDFCSQKKSLRLIETPEKSAITMSQRFFGAVNMESCLKIEIKHPTSLNRKLTRLILRLFPNVELLIFEAQLDQSNATNFISLLSHWENISTLSMEKCVDPHYNIPIASVINRLEKLIRLDLASYFNTALLLRTLRRIQHLSLGFNYSTSSELLDIIRRIGPNCSRLWIQNYGWRIVPGEVFRWIKVNVGLCQRLTHFGCFLSYSDTMEIIGAHFPSLHTMYIDDSHSSLFFTELNHISTLSELHILKAGCWGLDNTSLGMLRQMVNVHTFEFRWARYNQLAAEDVQKFCTILTWLLPNVKHLILVLHELAEVEMFKQNLFMFRNLCTHEVKQWSKIE